MHFYSKYRFLIIIIIFSFFGFDLFAFESNVKVLVTPKWKIGDEKVLNITENREEIDKQGNITFKYRINYNVKIKVIDFKNASYTLNWKSNIINIDTTYINILPIMKSFYEVMMLKEFDFNFETDANGIFSQIDNWEEMKDKIMSLLLNKYYLIWYNRLTIQEINSLFMTFSQFSEDQKSFVGTFFKDLLSYFSFYGSELELKKPIINEIVMPNPFGGEPITGVIHIEYIEYDSLNSQYKFISRQTIDYLKSKEYLEKLMINLMPSTIYYSEKEMDDAIKSLNYIDEKNFQYDSISTWFNEIYSIRKVGRKNFGGQQIV